MRWVGLGIAAGAVFVPSNSWGQDTTKIKVAVPAAADSLIRRDSTRLPRTVPLPQPSDTIKAPLAHAPVPRLIASDRSLHFDRAQIFSSGSVTLQDLLARVLIATPFSAGYVSAPASVAVGGDFRRTRVFIDGIEYDALDARSNGVVDYSQIQLWSAEDITIEQAATEVRVHLRTWRVDNTAAYTRTDIGTGDQQLNVYRGFFGRRFDGGQALQIAAQQYGTTPPNYLGSSADQLGIIGRLGWAGKTYSVDGFASRVNRHRGLIRAFGRIDSLPGVESTRTEAYLRLGYHDADTSGTWAQVVASKGQYKFNPDSTTVTKATTTAADSIPKDTTRSQLQYLAAVGINAGPFRVALAARMRHSDTVTLVTPRITGSYGSGGFFAQANVEGKSADSLSRADVVAELTVGGVVRAGAGVDRAVDHRTAANGLVSIGMRAWGGIRLASLWLDGGVIRRDSAVLVGETLLGDSARTTFASPAAGLTLRLNGRVWKALFADINALRWNDTASVYRPQYQTRAQLSLQTTLPDRFPKGNFGMLVSARHEYRSASLIPSGTKGQVLRAQGERSVSTLLEFRIYSAVVSWQVRNVIGTRNYQSANYLMPRTTNFYGVRWEFWN